ncbi:MAG: transcription elongation factor GreA, partial [Puniceicoccales bacterium]
TSESISFLVERDCGEMVHEHFKRWLNEQNLKGPVLYWIVKNRNSRKFAKLVEGMVGTRMLNAILYAIDYEALQSTGNRRIQLADVLSDDQELIPDMLADANDEVARDLAQGLILNQGFEDLTKKSLLARFIKRFPSIQNLVSGEAEQKVDELIVSQKSLDDRKAEYEELINKKIPENKEAIEVAREHGDLRENAEYKMARQDQETLMARKALLEKDFNRARVTTFEEVSADTVGIGSIVVVEDTASGEVQEYALLGAWDSAPEQSIMSYKTPLGQALMNKHVGDTVQTEIDNTVYNWKIKSISRWLDSGRTL